MRMYMNKCLGGLCGFVDTLCGFLCMYMCVCVCVCACMNNF